MRLLEGEEKMEGKFVTIMTKNFPKLMSETQLTLPNGREHSIRQLVKKKKKDHVNNIEKVRQTCSPAAMVLEGAILAPGRESYPCSYPAGDHVCYNTDLPRKM